MLLPTPVLLLLCSWTALAIPPTDFASGPFLIRYHPWPVDRPAIEILYGLTPIRHLWFTATPARPGDSGAFLSAARINDSVTQNGGDFIFKAETLETCSDAVVLDASSRQPPADYPVVYFKGRLCDKVDFELQFQAVSVIMGDTSTTHLLFNVSLPDASVYNQLNLTYGCERDEQFFGFGAQYTELSMKGKRLPLFLSEQGVGRGLWPLTQVLDTFSPGAGTYIRLY